MHVYEGNQIKPSNVGHFNQRKNKMDKKTQIELAKYIVDVLYVNDFPHDAEHIYNAIECFYDETYKEAMLVRESVSAEEQADFELEQLFNVNESDQLGLYK
jgi:hypothetical protein